MKTIVDNHSVMLPQNSCQLQRIQSYLAIRSFASIQACGATMSSEQQARKMLTSTAQTTGGFEYAGEYYTACCAFLSGTDPSMPSKALLQPNDLNSTSMTPVSNQLLALWLSLLLRIWRLSLRRLSLLLWPSVSASRLRRPLCLATFDLLIGLRA